MGRPSISNADRIRKFLQENKGKPVTAAQIKASHPKLEAYNVNAVLVAMTGVVQKGHVRCPISDRRSLGWVWVGEEEEKSPAKPSLEKKAAPKPSAPATETKAEDRPLTVKEKIRSVGKRCTDLERTVEKQAKQIQKLEASLAKLEQASTPTKTEEAPTAAISKPAVITPENEGVKLIAEITAKLNLLAEKLNPKSDVAFAALSSAIGDRAKVEKSLNVGEAVIEAPAVKIKFLLATGAFAGKVNDLPVKGHNIKELLAVLPAAPTVYDNLPIFVQPTGDKPASGLEKK